MLKIGDICTYSYDDIENKSFCIVKITSIKNEETCSVKFLEVINDDSGNGMFKYLLSKNEEMNVSIKYLKKIVSSEVLIEKINDIFSETIEEMVNMMFDDNMNVCKISNCCKGGNIPCGDNVCIQENTEYWKEQINCKIRGIF